MSVISKTTFTFTVLHRTDQSIEELEHALRESWDGHAVGLENLESTVEVPDHQVEQELVELGNDGTFFDDDLNSGTCMHCGLGIWWDEGDEVWRHDEHEGATCGTLSPETVAEPDDE